MPTFDNYFMQYRRTNIAGALPKQAFLDFRRNRNDTTVFREFNRTIGILRGYAIAKNGEGSESVFEQSNASLYPLENNQSRCLIGLQPFQIAGINSVDRWVYTLDGIEYIFNINDGEIITAFDRQTFDTALPDEIFEDLVQGSASAENTNNQVNMSIFTLPNNPLYDIHLQYIEGLTIEDPLVFPYLVQNNPEQLTFTGRITQGVDHKIGLSIGRIPFLTIPFYFYSIEITTPAPANPTENPEIITRRIFVEDIRIDGNQVKAIIEVLPELESPINNQIILSYQRTRPMRDNEQTRRFNYTGRKEYDLFPILAGEHYEFNVGTLLIPNDFRSLIESVSYLIRRVADMVIPDTVTFNDDILAHTKIHIDELNDITMKIALLNDLFNLQDVTAVNVEASTPGGTLPFVFSNMIANSEIICDFDGLVADTLYDLVFKIDYLDEEIRLDSIKIKTLETLPNNPNESQKSMYVAKGINRRFYSNNESNMIEQLTDEKQLELAQSSFEQINNPATDQRPHDHNPRNRKGSAYNNARSPNVYSNFRKDLASLLADAIKDVPDIDEEFRE